MNISNTESADGNHQQTTNAWKLLAKLLVSGFFLWFLYHQVAWSQFSSYLQHVSIWSLVAAIVAYQLAKLAMGWRLFILTQQLKMPLSFWGAIQMTYRSSLFSLFLPGSIGGDGYRWLCLKRMPSISHRSIMKVLIFDRLSGLVALIGLLLICGSLSSLLLGYLDGMTRILFTISLLLLGYISYWLLSRRFFSHFHPRLKSIELSSYAIQVSQVIVILILASNYWMWLKDASGLMTLFLLSSVVSLLPITLGGIGSREMVFYYSSDLVGLPQEVGLILGTLFYGINVSSVLPGLLMKDVTSFPANQSLLLQEN